MLPSLGNCSARSSHYMLATFSLQQHTPLSWAPMVHAPLLGTHNTGSPAWATHGTHVPLPRYLPTAPALSHSGFKKGDAQGSTDQIPEQKLKS